MKKVLLLIISLILGLTFIFSSLLKLSPVEIFEFAIAETGIFSWGLSAFFARIIIAVELLLGILLIFRMLPKITIITSFSLTLFFSFYLLYLLFFQGNVGNCNCFGIHYVMTPTESLFKNLIILSFLACLFYFSEFKRIKHKKIIFPILFTIVSFIIPFALNPISFTDIKQKSELIGKPLNLSQVYDESYVDIPNAELRKGKWIIFFASATCQHCYNAAYKLNVINKKITNLPLYFFLNGDEEDITHFHTITNTKDIPYSNMPAASMIFYTQGKLPLIVMINYEIIENSLPYSAIDEKIIRKWLSE